MPFGELHHISSAVSICSSDCFLNPFLNMSGAQHGIGRGSLGQKCYLRCGEWGEGVPARSHKGGFMCTYRYLIVWFSCCFGFTGLAGGLPSDLDDVLTV